MTMGLDVPIYSEVRRTRGTGYPFLFPTLFGSGSDGALTASTTADVGYLTFGAKQYTNLTLPAGQTWTVAQGTSNGGLIIAGKNKVTIAGGIVADGQAGASASGSASGTGGATAGAGAQTAGVAVNGAGTAGNTVTKIGHGTGSYGAATAISTAARAGGSGAWQSNNAAAGVGGSGGKIEIAESATFALRYFYQDRMIMPTQGVRFNDRFYLVDAFAGGTNGTTAPSAYAFDASQDYAPSGNRLSFSALPHGGSGCGGSVTGVAGQIAAGGGGGGGGGLIYIEADTIELTAGYSITANGGNGGAGHSSNGSTAVGAGGTAGDGGLVVLVCRTLIGSTSAITVNAGTGGAGAGTSAASGLNGLAGALHIFKV